MSIGSRLSIWSRQTQFINLCTDTYLKFGTEAADLVVPEIKKSSELTM